jgi:acyl carrier protein
LEAYKLDKQNSRRQDLEQQILELIIREAKLDPSRITPEATLASLEVHSIDIVMLMMSIEDKFGVYIPIDGRIAEAKDVSSFVRSVAEHLLGKQ